MHYHYHVCSIHDSYFSYKSFVGASSVHLRSTFDCGSSSSSSNANLNGAEMLTFERESIEGEEEEQGKDVGKEGEKEEDDYDKGGNSKFFYMSLHATFFTCQKCSSQPI